MKLTADGQITIPVHIRQQADLSPGCELDIRYENGPLWLEKTAVETVLKRQQVMAAIKQIEGSANANLGLSTDEMVTLTRSEV